jgi:LacI family transcriptional regulator
MMALGAIRAASEAGLEVPRDVSVVGFDDIQLAEYINPSLTTLRQQKTALGIEAGRALLRLIDGEEDVPAAITLPVDLIVRASTGTPAP